MKRNIKLICLLGSVLCAIGFSSNVSFSAALAGETIPDLNSTYDLYDTVRIPTHTFNTSKGSATVKGVVILPDGTSFNSDSLSINQIGKYEVRYSATIKGEECYYSTSFLVKKPLFEYTNPTNSSVSYSTPIFAKSYTDAKGAYVTLAKGDTLTINQLIDVSSTTKLDKIINLFATPYTQGVFDFSRIDFVLRDSENPNTYLTVMCNAQSQLPKFPEYCYFRAGGQNQTLTGKYTVRETGAVKYQTQGIIGTLAKISLHAAHNDGKETPVGINPETEPVYFSYDASDVAIHTPCRESNMYPESTECADLDDTDYFKTNLWNGFPSKKAYLSITCSRFNGNAARFCITDIFGVDINNKYIEDNNAPEISVNFPSDKMPVGQINVSYTIPSATAFDNEERLSKAVTTKVFYGYGTTNQISVPIFENTFIPRKNGVYCIEYTAKDAYGNEAVKTLLVHVGGVVNPIDFDLPEIESSILGGESLNLPEVSNTSGGVGYYKTSIEVTDSLGKQTVEAGKFTPRVIGNNEIKYIVTDYNGNYKTKSVNVQVQNNTNPVLLKIENLEDTYITNYLNSIPSCYVNVVDGEKVVQKLCDLEVVDNSGTRQYKPNNVETFKVYGNYTSDSATLNFKYNDIVVTSKDIKLIESKDGNGFINLSEYFIGSNFTSSSYSAGAVAGIKIENTDSISNWKYFNKLTARNAKLILYKLHNYDKFGFSKIQVTLRDSENPNCSLTLTSFEDYFNISTDPVKYAVNLKTSSSLSINMDNTDVFVNGVSFGIKYYDDGTVFNGFPSEKINLEVTSYGENSKYVVGTINNFLMYKPTDNVLPDFVLTGDYGGSYSVGKIYDIARMVYCDVVKPYSKATLSVSIDGEPVTALDGTLLTNADAGKDYQIVLSKTGTYSFVYSFEGENDVFSYAVYSLDSQAPTINITSEVPTSITKGTAITIPSFEIVDDTTATKDITVIVSIVIPTGTEKLMMYTLPNEETGENEMITISNSLVTLYTGTYRLKITAIDATGNSSMKMIEILVK